MQRTVVLLRHAETAPNVDGLLNSTTDVGLTERGATQAHTAAAALAALAPFAFVRSDARRARETAAPLADLVGHEPEVDPRLAEVDFGPFEGAPPAEADTDPAYLAWHRGEAPPDGGPEPLEAAADRAESSLRDILDRHPDTSTFVVVSHGLLLRTLLCRVVLEVPAASYRRLVIDNARACVVRIGDGEPRTRLLAMNVAASDLDIPDA